MKRIALIAAAVLLLGGMGGGAFFYLKPRFFAHSERAAAASHHKTAVATKAENKKTSDGEGLLQLVQKLGGIQDRIIYGDHGALAEQRRLLQRISRVLQNFEKQDWNDYANVRAAFIYVLSGGDYHALASLTKDDTLSEADRALARGIIQIAGGQVSEAQELLGDIDPRSLDVGLVGPFALAQASLYIGQDDAKAIARLDDARLTLPHTAIEEAAARREIPILVKTGQSRRAMMLMSDYVRRFGKSIYAAKLFRDFARVVAESADFANADVVAELVSETKPADPKVKTNLFLDLAAESLARGRIAVAKAAASEVLAVEPDASEERRKAMLYKAAAEAPTLHAAEALQALSEITSDRLSEDDAQFHEVAGYIARTVSDSRIGNVAPPKPKIASQTVSNKPALPGRVASAIETADAALKKANMFISGNDE
jgi:chemotaxis protein MotC